MADTESDPNADTLIGELLGIVPRLLDRTQRQAAFSARTLAHLPCIGWLLSPRPADTDVPAHEAPQPADVLSVLATHPQDPAPEVPSEDDPSSVRPLTAGENQPEDVVVPDVESLPIPGYESLAASQVIPRLAALSPEELKAVGAYERANRRRQTILHRVARLLSE